MPVGRPTKYKPEYCEKLVQSAKRNESIQRFCADIGIHTDTYYGWKEKHREFSGAHKEAVTIRQANYMDKAMNCAFDPNENPCNNGMAYIIAYNLGLKIKPEKEDNTGAEDVADALRDIAKNLK